MVQGEGDQTSVTVGVREQVSWPGVVVTVWVLSESSKTPVLVQRLRVKGEVVFTRLGLVIPTIENCIMKSSKKSSGNAPPILNVLPDEFNVNYVRSTVKQLSPKPESGPVSPVIRVARGQSLGKVTAKQLSLEMLPEVIVFTMKLNEQEVRPLVVVDTGFIPTKNVAEKAQDAPKIEILKMNYDLESARQTRNFQEYLEILLHMVRFSGFCQKNSGIHKEENNECWAKRIWKQFDSEVMSALVESELQRLEIRICDVEGTLKFCHQDLKSWKQNIVKCLKLFHSLVFVIEQQKHLRVSTLLKRMVGCVSVIFSRSIPYGIEPPKQPNKRSSIVAQPQDMNFPLKPRYSMCNLGGVTTNEVLQRGIEIKSSEAMREEEDYTELDNEYFDLLRQIDIIHEADNDRRKVAQVNNIEEELNKYIIYLGQCENSTSKLLDTNILTCGFELENAFICIDDELNTRRKNHLQTSNKVEELIRSYRRIFKQKHNVKKIQKADQSVQASIYMPSQVRRTSISTQHPAPTPNEITTLNFTIAHYKQQLLRLNRQISQHKSDNDRYVQITNALYTQIMHTQTINLRLQEKLNQIANYDFKQELDLVMTTEGNAEVRTRLVSFLEGVSRRVGIDRVGVDGGKKRVQLSLPKDIIKTGGVEKLFNHINAEIHSSKKIIDEEKELRDREAKSTKKTQSGQKSQRKLNSTRGLNSEQKENTRKIANRTKKRTIIKTSSKNIMNKTEAKNLYKSKKFVRIQQDDSKQRELNESQLRSKKLVPSKSILHSRRTIESKSKSRQRLKSNEPIIKILKEASETPLTQIAENIQTKKSQVSFYQQNLDVQKESEKFIETSSNFNTRHLLQRTSKKIYDDSLKAINVEHEVENPSIGKLCEFVDVSRNNLNKLDFNAIESPSEKNNCDKGISNKFIQTSKISITIQHQPQQKSSKNRKDMRVYRTLSMPIRPTPKRLEFKQSRVSQLENQLFDLRDRNSSRSVNEETAAPSPANRFNKSLSKFSKVQKNLPRLTLDLQSRVRGSFQRQANKNRLKKGLSFYSKQTNNQQNQNRTSLLIRSSTEKKLQHSILQHIYTCKRPQQAIYNLKRNYPNCWLDFFCRDPIIREYIEAMRRHSNMLIGYRTNFSKLLRLTERNHMNMCGNKNCDHIKKFYSLLQQKIKWMKMYPDRPELSPLDRTLSQFEK